MLCPFCNAGFVSATGLAHHFESAACSKAPFLNRETIYQIVRSKDPKGFMSKKMIGWTKTVGTEYEATERSWDGQAFECYLCQREFKQLTSLNQHLKSSTRKYSIHARLWTFLR